MTAVHPLAAADADGVAGWTAVCPVAELTPDRGVCALVADTAVAVFLTSHDGRVRAIGNHDPFADASVLSRGLVGWADRDGELAPYVASPLRKHRFDLRTGRAWADPSVTVGSFAARVRDGVVEVASPTCGPGARTLPGATVPKPSRNVHR